MPFVPKVRPALACLFSLAVAAALPGCGSSSVTKPTDAAADALVAIDAANPDVGLEAAQPDRAVDIAVVVDAAKPDVGLDAPQADAAVDTAGAADVGSLVDGGGSDGGLLLDSGGSDGASLADGAGGELHAALLDCVVLGAGPGV